MSENLYARYLLELCTVHYMDFYPFSYQWWEIILPTIMEVTTYMHINNTLYEDRRLVCRNENYRQIFIKLKFQNCMHSLPIINKKL